MGMKWYIKWNHKGFITGPYTDFDEAKQEIAENICGFEHEADDDGSGMIFSDAIFSREKAFCKVDLKDGYKAVVPVIGDKHG